MGFPGDMGGIVLQRVDAMLQELEKGKVGTRRALWCGVDFILGEDFFNELCWSRELPIDTENIVGLFRESVIVILALF